MALTRLAHKLVRDHFLDKPKGLAIDGTCGNGHDTEFLARLEFDQVIGFDIQDMAIENTQKRIDNSKLSNVMLVKTGHQNLEKHINRSIDCAMFNFGYLPKADKSITTVAETSIFALNSTLRNLCDTGLICMICYPGHTEGTIETHSIQKWLTGLDTSSHCITKFDSNHPNKTTPILYTVSIKS